MFLLEERTELILYQMVLIKDFMHGGVFEGWGELLHVRLSQVKDTFPELWSHCTKAEDEAEREGGRGR